MNKRRISYQRFAEIYRSMNGDHEQFDEPVTIEDTEGLQNADTFGEFVDANRDRVQLFVRDNDMLGTHIASLAGRTI